MVEKWKEVKAQKEYQCLCCGRTIKKGDQHYVCSTWKPNSMYPQIDRYCSGCGVHVKQGCSFNEARKRAFGSPEEEKKEIWFCDCGAMNYDDPEKCFNCGTPRREKIES